VFTAFKIEETPLASGGACSTAMDVATFGQMFLNRGSYGDAGIRARFGDQLFPEASWGLGWSTCEGKKSVGYAEPLQSPKAFSHGGAGGVFVWVDPTYDLVGAYFPVWSYAGIPAHVHFPDVGGELIGRIDLFINAVTAAVVDAQAGVVLVR
jgi:CubicO group peptidase (beta-lactamase class C family)